MRRVALIGLGAACAVLLGCGGGSSGDGGGAAARWTFLGDVTASTANELDVPYAAMAPDGSGYVIWNDTDDNALRLARGNPDNLTALSPISVSLVDALNGRWQQARIAAGNNGKVWLSTVENYRVDGDSFTGAFVRTCSGTPLTCSTPVQLAADGASHRGATLAVSADGQYALVGWGTSQYNEQVSLCALRTASNSTEEIRCSDALQVNEDLNAAPERVTSFLVEDANGRLNAHMAWRDYSFGNVSYAALTLDGADNNAFTAIDVELDLDLYNERLCSDCSDNGMAVSAHGLVAVTYTLNDNGNFIAEMKLRDSRDPQATFAVNPIRRLNGFSYNGTTTAGIGYSIVGDALTASNSTTDTVDYAGAVPVFRAVSDSQDALNVVYGGSAYVARDCPNVPMRVSPMAGGTSCTEYLSMPLLTRYSASYDVSGVLSLQSGSTMLLSQRAPHRIARLEDVSANGAGGYVNVQPLLDAAGNLNVLWLERADQQQNGSFTSKRYVQRVQSDGSRMNDDQLLESCVQDSNYSLSNCGAYDLGMGISASGKAAVWWRHMQRADSNDPWQNTIRAAVFR